MSHPPPDRPRLGKKHRVLLRVESFGRRHYAVVFTLGLLALVAGTWLGSRLEIESNILALIPAGNPQVDRFREAVRDFGSVDYLILMLEAGENEGADELEDFADRLARDLRDRPELIERVDYRFELDDAFVDFFYDNALLFVPPDRLPQLAAKLSDRSIEEQLQRIALSVITPTATFLPQELLRDDPLELRELFLTRLLENRGVMPFDVTDGYYLSRDQRKLIMLVKPTGPSQDLEFDARLLDGVREIVEAARRPTEGAVAPRIQVRFGGNYAIAVDEAALIRDDVRRNLVLSLVAVSALYWLCYRRFAALLYSSVPLLVGQALTFGLCFFVLGGLNASSSAFTALLMGLGTDFVIVVYARYIEERQQGKSLAEATELMIGETGLGVFTGAITSAGTFYAMCISQFRGLRDLGVLIGSGILFCALAILFLLPAMIKWNEGVRRRKVDAVRKLHLQSFLLEHLIPFSARHRRPVIAVVVGLTLLAGWAATRLGFDDTIQVLRSNRSPAYQLQQEMAQEFGASLSYMLAVAEGQTAEQALELTERIERRLRPFLDDGTVTSYDSILAYLPPVSQQQRVLQEVAAGAGDAFDPQRVQRTFLHSVEPTALRAEAFAGFLDRLQRFLAPQGAIRIADLEQHGMGHLLERYVQAGDGGTRVVTYLFLSDARWKREPPPGLVETLTAGDPQIVVTGTNIVGREFRRIFSREAPQAVLLGLVVVFVLLWIDFRSLRLTLIALCQLVCGVILMLGMMKASGVHLNYVNAFVATMILGVGIDYSIHLVHRMHLCGGRPDEGLLETGKAVVMAALTNIAGFGTLVLAHYPALRSFGTVAMFGSAACLFTALTLVPALMASRADGAPRGGA
jgi:predicted RND superfamily exporter protein